MDFITTFLESLIQFTNSPTFLFDFLSMWGWLVFLFPVIWMAKHASQEFRVEIDRHKWKWVLLAIDVPKDNEQGPKAVENIFSHLAGAHSSMDVREIHWDGVTQKWFSFEIVSIEGYVQFLVYTEKSLRNLVEATIYSQYPDAEITEVEDYAKGMPTQFPNEDYDMWGCDFKLVNSQYYPLRGYREFEDMRTGDFMDPMHALLETMSRMGPGEQLWLQLLIKPIGVEWKKEGRELVKKLAGVPPEHHKSALANVGAVPGAIVGAVANEIFGAFEAGEEKKKPEMLSKMLYLTPGERSGVEAVEKKLAKIGFSCKMRVIYVAKKANFQKTNAVQAIVGSMKQFNTEDLNAIIPDMRRTAVTAHYIMVDTRKQWRKTRLMSHYKSRSIWGGTPQYVLNIEELATLWHFPVLSRTPLLKKTTAKRAEPPGTIMRTR